MEIKKIATSLLAIGISSVSMLAQASDLTLTNNTDLNVTSYINGKRCSTDIPDGTGVTKPHSKNKVKELYVILACRDNRESCAADVHLSSDCSGSKIATVVINSKNYTVTSINMNTADYVITPSGFGFILDPAPKLSRK